MIRINVLTEGDTEDQFITTNLSEHFAHKQMVISYISLRTSALRK